MTLILDLNPKEAALLHVASHRQGIDMATYAKRLVTDHLPDKRLSTEHLTDKRLTLEEYDRLLADIARPLTSIPHEKQTREYIYVD